MSDRQLENVAHWTPVLILAYFAAQFVIRISLSGNLETDEAQFVGQTYLALGYNNSHPPLYNWLVAGALALTGGSWPAALALIKNLLLAGTYLLAFDIARRVTGRALPGLIVVASFLLLPQIVWKSQVTLAHTVLVMFAAVAVMHAAVLIMERGDRASFAWLGLAAAVGALAKYNFFLVLAAVFIAAYSIPAMRLRLFSPRLVLAGAIFAALLVPHYIWAVLNFSQTTQRMAKLEREDSVFNAVDIPWIGIDGFLSLVLSLAAWAAPLLIVWYAAGLFRGSALAAAPEPFSMTDDKLKVFAQFFGRTTIIGVAAFAAITLAADLHSVRERYLTPVLMSLPFWLVFAWPLTGRAPIHFLRVGAVMAGLMVTAWPLWIAFGKEQFAYPYRSIAGALDSAIAGPFAILAAHDKYGANVAIRLDRASRWDEASPSDQVVVLWEPKAGRSTGGTPARLKDAYEPRGAVIPMAFPYDNLSGQKAQLNAQLYARKP